MYGGHYYAQTYHAGFQGPAAPSTDLQILIDAVDYAVYLMNGTFSFSSELGARTNLSLQLFDETNSLSVDVGQQVIVNDGGSRIFAGSIERLTNQWPVKDVSSAQRLITIECVDYNQIMDRLTVAENYEDGTNPAVMVRDILTDYLTAEGVTEGLIESSSFDFGTTIFNYDTVADALKDLADTIGYITYIDHHKRLFFCDCGSVVAPWSLTNANARFMDLTVERNRESYRNRQIFRAGRDISGEKTEKFKGEAGFSLSETQTITISAIYDYSDPDNPVLVSAAETFSRPIFIPVSDAKTTFNVALSIAEEPTILVNGAVQTVGIRELETGFDWYWQKDSNEISQDEDATPLYTTDILTVTYKGFYPLIVIVNDSAEQSTRAGVEANSGIYEAIEDDERIESFTFASQRANGFLAQYGRLPNYVKFTAQDSGLEAGQLLTITLSREGLSGSYVIQSVSAQDLGINQLEYSVECTEDAVGTRPSDFFRRLARAGRKFALRENEQLGVVRSSTDGFSVAHTLTQASGNTVSAWTTDPYTFGLVGSAVVGKSKTGQPDYVS